MSTRRKISTDATTGAPLGEKTTLAGTEYFPISGSQVAKVSSVYTFTRTVDNSYVIAGGFAASSPADGTTYYFGGFPHVALGTTADLNRLYILRDGIICAADIFMTATTGSNEVSTLSLRLNNTTDTALSAAVALDASPFHVQNTALNISVVQGDYFEFKWVTPTWATNPTGVLGRVEIFIK